MKSLSRRILLTAIAATTTAAATQTVSANPLRTYRWKKRPVLLFADSARHPAYKSQKQLIARHRVGMRLRDQVLVEVVGDKVSVNGRQRRDISARSLRGSYQAPRSGFTFVLLGKDGGVKRRSRQVQDPTSWFCQIDRMPMRRQEMASSGQKSAC